MTCAVCMHALHGPNTINQLKVNQAVHVHAHMLQPVRKPQGPPNAKMHRLCVHDPAGHEACSSHPHTDCTKFSYTTSQSCKQQERHVHSPSLIAVGKASMNTETRMIMAINARKEERMDEHSPACRSTAEGTASNPQQAKHPDSQENAAGVCPLVKSPRVSYHCSRGGNKRNKANRLLLATPPLILTFTHAAFIMPHPRHNAYPCCCAFRSRTFQGRLPATEAQRCCAC